jgi:hypothetical protein
MLYHLNQSPNLFCFTFFSYKVPYFCPEQPGLWSYLCFPHSWITGMCHQSWLLDEGWSLSWKGDSILLLQINQHSLPSFLWGLAGPSTLHFPSQVSVGLSRRQGLGPPGSCTISHWEGAVELAPHFCWLGSVRLRSLDFLRSPTERLAVSKGPGKNSSHTHFALVLYLSWELPTKNRI